ncbi:MAG TPA: hypothetical protein VF066_18550 [Thermoleophilaceae bacterium]
MTKRFLPTTAAMLACACLAGTPALATDDPPPQSQPPATTPTGTTPVSSPPSPVATSPDATAPAATAPAACADTTRPRTKLKTTSRAASRRHTLRGTATDVGCANSSVALVSVSVALQKGKKCHFLAKGARFSRKKSSCAKPHWVSAHGTATWSLRLPTHLAHGRYRILTRAVDSAGNVEKSHVKRLAIR